MRPRMRSFVGLVLLSLIIHSECIDAPDLSEAKAAFKEIKDSLSSIPDNKIVKKVMMYGKIIGHTAVAIKTTVTLIQSLMGGPKESKELQFMREQFGIINTKLDALDHDFNDVRNLIDWRNMKVNVGNYERSIKALERKLTDYLNAPVAAAQFFGDIFVQDYVRGYNDAALKVYIAMSSQGSIFQDNVLNVARKQLKNDQAKLAEFAGYILRIIERGIAIESAYLSIQKLDNKQAELKKEWADRFKALESVAARVDKEVHDAWIHQYKTDSDEFAVRNANLNNKDMATGLMSFLKAKYPWRWWFIFVYTFTNNNDKDRYFENCDGFVKVNAGNKVVIVNSIAPGTTGRKSDPSIFFRRIYRRETGFGPYDKLAKKIYERSPSGCHLYYFKGVFEAKSQPSFWAPTGHFISATTSLLRSFHNYKDYIKYVFV